MAIIQQALDVRMKSYEVPTQNVLIPHMPTILRLDGVKFSTYTRGLDTYDNDMARAMVDAMTDMTREIQNVVIAYTFSDEISFLLVDYPNLNTGQWYGGNIQKMVSVSASMLAAKFNRSMSENDRNLDAYFDARVYQLPRQEVLNYFRWRQGDCIRNSQRKLILSHMSHKESEGLSNNTGLAYIKEKHNVCWDDLGPIHKHGCVYYTGTTGWYLRGYNNHSVNFSDVEGEEIVNNRVNLEYTEE